MSLSQNRKGDRLELDGGRFRVEAGPALKRAKATETLLSNDQTAEHYQHGLPDAKGEEITLGQHFHYLDYLNPYVFYLYEKVDVDPSDPDSPYHVPEGSVTLRDDNVDVSKYTYVYEERGAFETEDEAVAQAERLAA
jgi:hypothetical protein